MTDTSEEDDIHINDRLVELGVAEYGMVRMRPKNILNKLIKKLGLRLMQKSKSLKLNYVEADYCSLVPIDKSKVFLNDDNNVAKVIDKVEKEIGNNPSFLTSDKDFNIVNLKDYIRKVTKDLINEELKSNNSLASLKNVKIGSVDDDKVKRKIVNSSFKLEDEDDVKIKNIETVQDLLLVKDIVNSANYAHIVDEELSEKKSSSSSSGLKNDFKGESCPFGKPGLSKLMMPYDEYDEIDEKKIFLNDLEPSRLKIIEKSSSSSSSISKSNNFKDLANQNSSFLGKPIVSKLIMSFDNDDNFGTQQESSSSAIAKSDCIDWEFFGVKPVVQQPEEKKPIQKNIQKTVRKNISKFNQKISQRTNQRNVPKFNQKYTQKINERVTPKVNEKNNQSSSEEEKVKIHSIHKREGFYKLFNDNQTNCVDNYQDIRKDESCNLALIAQTDVILQDLPKYTKIIVPKTYFSFDDFNPQVISAPKNCKNIFQQSYRKIIAERLAKKNKTTSIKGGEKNSVKCMKSEVEKIAEKVLDVNKESDTSAELDSDDLASENVLDIIPVLQEKFGQAIVDESFCSSSEKITEENKFQDGAKSSERGILENEFQDPTESHEDESVLDLNESAEYKIGDAGGKIDENESENNEELSSEEDFIPASLTSSSFAQGDAEKISVTTVESTDDTSDDSSVDSDVKISTNHETDQDNSAVDKSNELAVVEKSSEIAKVPATLYPSGIYPVCNDLDLECPSDESEWQVDFEVPDSRNAIEDRQDSEVDVDEIDSDSENEEARIETTNKIEEIDSDFEEGKQDIDGRNEIEEIDLDFEEKEEDDELKENEKMDSIVQEDDKKIDFEDKEKDTDTSINEKNDLIVEEDEKENQDSFVHQNDWEISSIKSKISTESGDNEPEIQVKKTLEHVNNDLEKNPVTPKPKLSILTTIKNLGLHENCNLSPPPVLNMSLNEYRKKND